MPNEPDKRFPPGGWEGFQELARTLRSEAGCPWDRQQTTRSLLPYLVEEAHEALHAAEQGDDLALREELGDVCFVLTLTLQVLEEEGRGEFSRLADRTLEKIRRRHPHVFGGETVGSAEEVALRWEELKRAEEVADPEETHVPGALRPTSPALPALWQAIKLQNKAAAGGFDWESPEPILDKIREELTEVGHELTVGGDQVRLRDELGDLLFAVTNLARKIQIDPESALRAGNEKFRRRYNRMMEMAAAAKVDPSSLGLTALDLLWDRVKAEERPEAAPDSSNAASE